MGDVVDTQRRRRRQEPETYATAPVSYWQGSWRSSGPASGGLSPPPSTLWTTRPTRRA